VRRPPGHGPPLASHAAVRLLHAQGSCAVVHPADEEQMSADGMTAADIAAIQNHLTMLRVNNLVPTRHGILQNLLDANGAPANPRIRPI